MLPVYDLPVSYMNTTGLCIQLLLPKAVRAMSVTGMLSASQVSTSSWVATLFRLGSKCVK